MIKQSIEKLCSDLQLPIGDDFTQDWIYELPEEYRNLDSFKKYFEAYVFNSYDSEVKTVLMDLMFDVTNELIEMGHDADMIAWNGLAYILAKDSELYTEQIEYWSVKSEPIENGFAITPYVRSLL